jgi:UDP-glucuronate 4-epimerase
MRAIVTGSSGFIGSALTELLLNSGWNVLGIDSHSDYYSTDLKARRLEHLQEYDNFEYSKIDVSDFPQINKAIKGFQPVSIFHLAAQAGVRIPTSELQKYVVSNLQGFASVLQATVLSDVPNFLFASSSSVYGDEAKIPYSENELNLNPNSFYGATKLSNEILSRSLIPGSNTRARGMRFFTVYGPEGRPDMAYFRIISSLLEGTEFELFGDGSIERDFTFVDDCTEMIQLLERDLQSKSVGYFDIVNIGGGHPISMNKLIEITSNYIGKTFTFKKGDPNAKDAKQTMADAEYLVSLVKNKPSTPIEEGVAKTVDWAKLLSPGQLASWVNSST